MRGGYNGLQGVTRSNERMQGITGGYKALPGFIIATGGYKRLQGVTGGYKRLQGITRDDRGLLEV